LVELELGEEEALGGRKKQVKNVWNGGLEVDYKYIRSGLDVDWMWTTVEVD
jgi:hypothetical protein